MKLDNKDKELIKESIERFKKAKKTSGDKLGEVGSILLTKNGNIYFGASVNLYCTLGGCGERSAILAMASNGEAEIDTIVATFKDKAVPPCGVCREMMLQMNKNNLNAWVIINNSEKVKLKELLPHNWQESMGYW